jgi:uncharacterized protein (TIGR00251 family)
MLFLSDLPITMATDHLLLHIKVTPKAAANRIGKVVSDASGKPLLKIYVTAVPEHGKANKAVLEFLAKSFGISLSQLSLIKGTTDHYKTICIQGEPHTIHQRIAASL